MISQQFLGFEEVLTQGNIRIKNFFGYAWALTKVPVNEVGDFYSLSLKKTHLEPASCWLHFNTKMVFFFLFCQCGVGLFLLNGHEYVLYFLSAHFSLVQHKVLTSNRNKLKHTAFSFLPIQARRIVRWERASSKLQRVANKLWWKIDRGRGRRKKRGGIHLLTAKYEVSLTLIFMTFWVM